MRRPGLFKAWAVARRAPGARAHAVAIRAVYPTAKLALRSAHPETGSVLKCARIQIETAPGALARLNPNRWSDGLSRPPDSR